MVPQSSHDGCGNDHNRYPRNGRRAPPRPSYSVNLTVAELTFEVGATVGVEFVIDAVALSAVVFEIGAVVGLAVVAVEVGIMVVGCLHFLADTKSNESALNLCFTMPATFYFYKFCTK